MNSFLNQKIIAVFPAEYFEPAMINSIIDQYGEYSADAGNTVKTIWQRQDTADPSSRRAAGPGNEQPLILNDGRMLVLDIFPSTGIFSAVNAGALSGVELVSAEALGPFLAIYWPSGEVV